jgi:hypothetical protein
MDGKLLGLVAVAALTIGAGVAGGAAIADAASTKSGTQAGYGGPGGGPGYGHGGAPHQHTTVTGTTLTKVKAAVKAKDSSVTVHQVLKDPDGSYDVFGTKAGKPVMLEVSKDLATVTERTGGPGGAGGRGGPGGSSDTPVSGSELAKVTAAVKAKDSSVTVEHVRKDPDGSYDVMGTKAGKPVMLEVSKDLATVTERTGGPGGGMPGGGPGKGGPPPAPPEA